MLQETLPKFLSYEMVPTCWMKEGFVIMCSHWNFWQIGNRTSFMFRNYSIAIWNQKKEAIIYKIINNRLTKYTKLILAFIFHFWSKHNAQNQMYLPQLVSYISEYKTFWNVYSLSTLDFLLFVSSSASLALKCSTIFLEN